jgi:charged multivesicular body protein 4
MNKELADAKKKNAAGNKRGALHHMKKKKMYEAEVEKLSGSKLNLE